MTVAMTRRGDTIILGDDEVRIEEGFVRKTATATEELLHDDNTHVDYHAGVVERTFNDALGKPYTVPHVGRDALGVPIRVGEEMTYYDRGGAVAPGSRCFYIFKKRLIDPTKQLLDDGTDNPHYVDDAVRGGAKIEEDGTPPNRTHYTYIFDEVATRKSEEDAIAYGRKLLGEKA